MRNGSEGPGDQKVSPINTIREAFRYMERFRGRCFVLKIEDALLDAPLFSMLIRDIVSLQKLGLRVVLVPGAKHSIDRILKTYGIPSSKRNNIRITTDDAMPQVRLGASNVTNSIISHLSENGAHGVMGNWVRARALGVLNGIDYHNTGKLEKVNVELIQDMLEDGLIPIIPNIGWNAVGKAYNLSSSELAVGVAVSLKAKKLFFIGNYPGIHCIPQVGGLESRPSGVYSNLDLAQGRRLLEQGAAHMSYSQRELVSLALDACRSGVDRVHVVDGSRDGILMNEIFSSSGVGTMFYANEHANIHPASAADVPDILRLMQPSVDSGVLVQRSAEQVGENLDRYFVYKVDDCLHGCAALKLFSDKLAELEALVVDRNYSGQGTGRRLVTYLLQRARSMGLKRVFILTTQSSDFFMRNGFLEGDLEKLPPERRESYNRKRNSRIFYVNL